MHKHKPIINKKYKLEKYPGKGGWTYAAIPEIRQDKNAPFGWVKVKGSIDNYELRSYKLMPMGKGKLFLPVKAEVRKIIGKQAGDWVNIVLYADNDPVEIPNELLLCLKDEPDAYGKFLSYTEGQQKEFIDWIYKAKSDVTRVKRIAASIEKLLKNKKLRDK
ncbi:MAG: YdeI/OmpD-associated family protein [Bacteroidetes bacterium]|nr:YdeI/OmpD-associated family protein [Bacteroidota bacterium]